MPQSSRASRHTDERERVSEQESKRNRGAISCAECRRLKLKCDKTVPCSSCTRRGCASICPNGSLTTGQGTRFILADTDRLHRKIVEMSDRIRQLEDALAILQASMGSREPHPLLHRDLLGIKSGLELHAANTSGTGLEQQPSTKEDESALDIFGTLAVRDDGRATFFGSSAGQESLLLEENIDCESPQVPRAPESLPRAIVRLNSTFPSAPTDAITSDLEDLLEFLPPWPRAAQLCDLYLEQAPWFFGPVTRRQLLDELLPMFYPESEAAAETSNTPPPSGTTVTFQLPRSKSNSGTPHDLALMFVVFCFGALTDPILPPAPNNVEANRYFDMTKAALNLKPVLDGNPSVATVQTLSLMGIYQGMVSDDNSIEITWAYMGLSCRLAQSIGLHRDSARWKLSTSEVQKRRALFWELFITDGFQSLATGRLPTFSLPFVDTELAADPDETLAEDGTAQPSFPAWKARFGQECIAPTVQATTKAHAPKYSVILELDRKIRDMELPKYATEPRQDGAGLSKTMAHYMPINYRELTLTYVHRCYFAQALSDHPQDPLRSPYAPSFLAGYRSACALLLSMQEQFELFPVQLARFWVLWTHAFSATVMLASIVTHGGITKTAQAAMGELRMSLDLFQNASKYGGRAVKFVPIIRRLHDKAYNSINQGFKMQKDIFTPRNVDGENQDELSIFGGRTHTVKSKTTKPSMKRSVSRRRTSPSAASSSGVPSPPESSRSSQSPAVTPSSSQDQHQQAGLPAPSYYHSLETYGNSVHPMLVDQMRSFEGQLEVQISNAAQYYLTPSSSASSVASPETVLPTSRAPTAEYPGDAAHGWHTAERTAHPPQPPPDIYHYAEPNQQALVPPQQHTSQPMFLADNHPQPQPVMHTMPMYGGAESNIIPLASSSQEQLQYPEFSMSISRSASQEYQHFDQPAQPYSQTWMTPSHSQSDELLPVYPTEGAAYELGAINTSQLPASQYQPHHITTPTHSESLGPHGHYQYQVPPPSQSSSQPPQYYPQYHQPMVSPPAPAPTENIMHHQHQHHQQPSAGVLPVHSGVPYSLQDAWTSFMQQELPRPGSDSSRSNTHSHQAR